MFKRYTDGAGGGGTAPLRHIEGPCNVFHGACLTLSASAHKGKEMRWEGRRERTAGRRLAEVCAFLWQQPESGWPAAAPAGAAGRAGEQVRGVWRGSVCRWITRRDG